MMARSFTANTDIISKSSPSTVPSTVGSFSLWFRPNWNAGDGNTHYFVDYKRSSDNARLEFSHAAGSFFAGWLSFGTRVTWADTGTASGTWYNMICIWDNGVPVTTAFINGVQKATNAVAITPSSGIDTLEIGNFAGANVPCNSAVADVAFWNVVLTAVERSALAAYSRPNHINPTALKGWWPVDGLQSPEPDLSGNKNNGTLTGTTAAFGPPVTMFTPRWPQLLVPFIPPSAPPAILMPQIIL